jgi:hypothetical protein
MVSDNAYVIFPENEALAIVVNFALTIIIEVCSAGQAVCRFVFFTTRRDPTLDNEVTAHIRQDHGL